LCHEERKAHGRQEGRWCYVGEVPKILLGPERWPGLKAIGMDRHGDQQHDKGWQGLL